MMSSNCSTTMKEVVDYYKKKGFVIIYESESVIKMKMPNQYRFLKIMRPWNEEAEAKGWVTIIENGPGKEHVSTARMKKGKLVIN